MFFFGAMDEQAAVDVDAEIGGGAMEGDMEMEDLEWQDVQYSGDAPLNLIVVRKPVILIKEEAQPTWCDAYCFIK